MRSLKQDLKSKRTALSNAINSSMGSSRGHDDRREMFKDPFGSASLTHDDEIAAAVVDRRAHELREVDNALAAIESGEYGICRDCGEVIAEKRLRVMPFATRCVGCQAHFEGLKRAA